MMPTSSTSIPRHRRLPVPKESITLLSEDLGSSASILEPMMKKNLKKNDSKSSDDQHLEEVISRAPLAAHAILKVRF
jgi:hypothetical protein